jgi:hypothetical protein
VRKLLLVFCALAALAFPALTHADSGPAWCGTASNDDHLCANALGPFSDQLGRGSEPYAHVWGYEHYKTPRIKASEDPDCPEVPDQSEEGCLAFYTYGGEYYFAEGYVTRSEVANDRATITHVFSYSHQTVNCSLGRDAEDQNIPGKLTSNNACGSGMPQSDVYFVSDELGAGEGGVVHYFHEVGWQFAGSGDYLPLNALATWHCTRGHTISCKDGVGDELAYTFPAPVPTDRIIGCRTDEPRSEILTLSESGTNCSLAYDVEQYTASHEAVMPFKVDGLGWHEVSETHAHGHTYFVFRAGRAVVRVVYTRPVS